MSYASFTKIMPDLLKSVPQKLLHPTGIAVMASVGIHALVGGVLLPHWSISSEKKSPPVRNVPLLQLTPKEQSRLPQVSPSSLPDGANQLPPLSSLPSSGSSSLPPLPSKDSSLFNLPPISPLPPLGKIPSLSQSPRQQINLNKLSIRNSPPRNDLSSLKQSTGSSSPLSKAPSNQLSSLPSSQLPTLPSSELPPPPRTPWPTTDLSNLPSVQPAPLPRFEPNQWLPPSTLPTQPLPPSEFPNQPLPSSTRPSILQPEYNPDPKGFLSRQSSSISMAPGVSTPTTPAAALVPSQGNLTNNSSISDRNNIAFLNNLGDWSKRNQINDLKRLDLAGNSPRTRSAGDSGSGGVAVAVMVDKNGKIISNTLEVTGSSGGNELDEEAKATVQGHSFPATGKVEAYVVRVGFNNDSSGLKSPTQLPPPAAPPNSAGLQNSPKGSTSTNAPRSTITGTPAQDLMEKLRKNLTNTPRSSTTDTPPSSTTDKPPSSTTNTSRSITTDNSPSGTTDKPPASTTSTSRSSTTDKPPANTTSTSRSSTTDKPPANTTNTSRSSTTDTSAQNLINKLRRSLSDTPRSSTTDTPPSKTTDTPRPNPTKE